MNTQIYKEKLLAEKKVLIEELMEVGHVSDKSTGEWEATPEQTPPEYDENSLADKFEDYKERIALKNVLEPKLQEVNDALQKIEDNTYGKCEECGDKIENDRLEANPSARNCKKHMN